MAENRPEKVTLKQLRVRTIPMTDALAKLMIAKGIITDTELKTQLTTERENYLAVLKRGNFREQVLIFLLMRTLVRSSVADRALPDAAN